MCSLWTLRSWGLQTNQEVTCKYVSGQEISAMTRLVIIYTENIEKVLLFNSDTYLLLLPTNEPEKKSAPVEHQFQLGFEDKFVGPIKRSPEKFVSQACMKMVTLRTIFQKGCMTADVFVTMHDIPVITCDEGDKFGNILFWPYLAPINYAANIIDKLKQEKAKSVLKTSCLLNFPEARVFKYFG